MMNSFNFLRHVAVAAVTFCFVLSISGCYRTHGGARVEAEIAALSAALESFHDDHGFYPSDPSSTELLKPNISFSPVDYISSAAFLYDQLSGKSGGKVYFEFSKSMLGTDAKGRTYIVDPWGNSYGYSTFKAKNPGSSDGNNEFYDLWSTHGSKKPADWTANW